MKSLLFLALLAAPLAAFANSSTTEPATSAPETALDRLKTLSLAVSQSKEAIAGAKTEEEVIAALQTMEQRLATLRQIKSDQPEPQPDKAEFMKHLPDIDGLQKEFAKAIEKFGNIALVSCQFHHSIRLHVYGRSMRSLSQEQVKVAIEQELEILDSSAKIQEGMVSVFEKSAAREPSPTGSNEAQEHAKAQLDPAKHRLALTRSSMEYLNRALANPWFKAAEDDR